MTKNPIAELVSEHACMCICEMFAGKCCHKHLIDFLNGKLTPAIRGLLENIQPCDYIDVFAVMSMFDSVRHREQIDISSGSFLSLVKNSLIFKCVTSKDDQSASVFLSVFNDADLIFNTCEVLSGGDADQFIFSIHHAIKNSESDGQ